MRSQIIESVSIAQARQTIAQAIRIYFRRDRMGQYTINRRRARPICLMGPAGIGKTEIVRQIAEENDLCFLSYSITHHTRQSIIGLPCLTESVVDGKPCTVTEYTMSEIIAQVHETMRQTGKQEGILFLDEFNCASESLRPIMLQLLQDKSFGPHAIPDGWMLVLAGNPSEYNRAATDLDPVTADRLRMIHIEPDYTAWRAYMTEHNIHPVVLSYLDNHKDHFYVHRRDNSGTALVTARGWEDLSVMLTELEQYGEQPDLAFVAQYIQAGDIARSFYGYHSQYAAIIESGMIDNVLNRSASAVSQISTMSFERAWCLVAALVQHMQQKAAAAMELDTTTAAVHKVLSSIKEQLSADPGTEIDGLLRRAAEGCSDRPVSHILFDYISLSVTEDSWDRIKDHFQKELAHPRKEAYQTLATQLSNLILICRKALTGKPHLEFLFRSLCSSPALCSIVASDPTSQFKQLFDDINYDNSDHEEQLSAMTKAFNQNH